MGTRITQEDRILQYLRENGSITSWQAIKEFGISRLSARIFNLRKIGYTIENEIICSKNRYGDPVHFVKYILKESKNGN